MSSTVIRYGAKRAIMVAAPRAYKRARMAGGVVRHIYHNRKTYARAARVIGRAYRRYRRFSKKRARKATTIGERVGKATAKRFGTQLTANNDADNTLHSFLITYPIKEVAADSNIDNRERDVINLRGIKLCWEFDSLNSTQEQYLNFAVISNKRDPTTTIVSTNRFFRGFNTVRGVDFPSVDNMHDKYCRPINTDEWNVHMRKRMRLRPTNETVGSHTRSVVHYLKLNRQIRFSNVGEPSAYLHCVWWSGPCGINKSTQNPDQFKTQGTCHMYYREPKA